MAPSASLHLRMSSSRWRYRFGLVEFWWQTSGQSSLAAHRRRVGPAKRCVGVAREIRRVTVWSRRASTFNRGGKVVTFGVNAKSGPRLVDLV